MGTFNDGTAEVDVGEEEVDEEDPNSAAISSTKGRAPRKGFQLQLAANTTNGDSYNDDDESMDVKSCN
jgi:hypothetical protein